MYLRTKLFSCKCAACKMLEKLTQDVNFINVLHTRFSYKIFGAKISNSKASFVLNFGAKNALLYEKRKCKTLMKLTIGIEVSVKSN